MTEQRKILKPRQGGFLVTRADKTQKIENKKKYGTKPEFFTKDRNTKIIKGKEYRKVKQIDPNKPDIFRLKSNKKAPKPKGSKRFAGGGMTTKGLGRAFMKGGKV